MASLALSITSLIIFFNLYICIASDHSTQQLLDDETTISTTGATYNRDCCERTSGLLYASIDCYDQNTPIILTAVQEYLMNPTYDCMNITKCAYNINNEQEAAETQKCLISWSLLQQYYNECPQLVFTTTNSASVIAVSNHNTDFETTDSGDFIDYEAAPKLINPYIYKIFYDAQDCDQCYGEYVEDGKMSCDGLCDFGSGRSQESLPECGVCSIVRCIGNINNLNDASAMYEEGALAIWQRSLLLVTVGILGCICCWGLCYLSCSGSNSWINRRLRGNDDINMMQVVGNESD